MPSLLRMPTPAAGVEEATLLEWSVVEHAAFARDDILFVIETDKAVIDVEAEEAGVLHRLLVGGGRRVPVGTPVAVIGAAGDSPVEIDALLAEAGLGDGAGAVDDEPTVDSAEAGEIYDGPADPPAVVSRAVGVDPAGATGPDPAAGHDRIFASPIARQMARNAGLDLAALTGTGPDGRIVRRDVQAAMAAGGPPPAAAPPAAAPQIPAPPPAGEGQPGFTDVPHTRIRRAIAARLTHSKQTVPHFYLRATPRVDALLALRAELNSSGGQKVSVNDLIVRAVARAHRMLPEMNVIFLDEATRHFDAVDIAVAVSTDGGLVTPVLREVDRRPITEIAAATADLSQRARAGRLRQQELDGGSITVTNLGMFGTEEFAAIINPPHSAILAVGAARREPIVDERTGELAAATVAHLVVSVDHRALDGVIAARWMAVLTELIEHPVRILA